VSEIRLGYFTSHTVWGGAEVYLDCLIRGAAQKCSHIIVFCPEQYPYAKGGADGVAKPDNCELVVYDRGTRSSRYDLQDRGSSVTGLIWRALAPQRIRKVLAAYQIKIAARVYREIPSYRHVFREHPVDLIHFNEICAPAIIAAKLEGIPVIVGTYHSLSDEYCHNFIQRALAKIYIRCVAQWIAVSEAVRDDWGRISSSAIRRIKVIYNGIDISSFGNGESMNGLRKELGIDGQALIVGVTARLEYEKGHIYLIEAARIVKREMPNVVYLIVGDGSLRKELEEYAHKVNLYKDFRFLGFRRDVIELTHIYDVAVLPSTSEALGYALIEAMACGKPVIGTRVGGIPEVIDDGETGYIAEPRDPESLAQLIIELISDREKAERMGKAGKGRAEQLFQESRMVKETLALYQHLLSERKIVGY
jgi:glycosyltransferase involved in cell wall biosynthesis